MKEYRYLEAEEGTVFPKQCARCGHTYGRLQSFLDDTVSVSDGAGLAEFSMDKDSNIVGVFRNCTCGSTLLVTCLDRRDMTEAGEARRRNFDKVLLYLEQLGIEREVAREELRKFMRGEKSQILEDAGLRR